MYLKFLAFQDSSNNLMSSMMSDLYSKPKPPSSSAAAVPSANKSSAEAIDISSDESGDESTPSKSNGKNLPKGICMRKFVVRKL